MSDQNNTPQDETEIRERAYALWNEAGQPEGREEEFWHRARETLEEARRSGTLGDQLSGSVPAGDPATLADPLTEQQSLPAAPQDEAAPANSATLEERPEAPAPAATPAAAPAAAKAKPAAGASKRRR
jgi:hypothetical protein